MIKKALIAATCIVATLIASNPLMAEKQQNEQEAKFVEEFLKIKFADSVSNKIPLVIKQDLSLTPLYDIKKDHVFDKLIQDAEKQANTRLVEAVKDFCEKNAGTNTFESIGTVNVSHILLSDNDVKFFRKSGWKEFYKKYPGSPGIITLSRTGFSKDGTLAVIYMGNQRGFLFGNGQINVFEKKDGKWVKTPILIGPCWIS